MFALAKRICSSQEQDINHIETGGLEVSDISDTGGCFFEKSSNSTKWHIVTDYFCPLRKMDLTNDNKVTNLLNRIKNRFRKMFYEESSLFFSTCDCDCDSIKLTDKEVDKLIETRSKDESFTKNDNFYRLI